MNKERSRKKTVRDQVTDYHRNHHGCRDTVILIQFKYDEDGRNRCTNNRTDTSAHTGQRENRIIAGHSGKCTLRQFIIGNKRFDQSLIDFLKHHQLPYIDMMTAHAEDYEKFPLEISPYLSRYFVGHYNPLGNFFSAFAIKHAIVKMTSPKSPAYLPPRR